jgi:hypothetical protein
MIETPKGSDNDLALGGRIRFVEASEQPAAGIEVGHDVLGQLQRRGSAQPLQQASLKVLNHRNLAKILPCRKMERTPNLIEALDELGAIKAHSSSRVCDKRLPSP